jgi:alpha-beta hydrolase superfamily lysophospholipase
VNLHQTLQFFEFLRQSSVAIFTLPPTYQKFLAGLAALCVVACVPQEKLVSFQKSVESKADDFGYRKWISKETPQDVILIGIHGFCGASIDYNNLGNHLLQHQPDTGLYAYEVRGQGSDPIHKRRGDIGDPLDWYRDLFAFTQLVQERHPRAKIVWFGESMGALIAAHSAVKAPSGEPACDGLILSSPIVRFRDDIPAWTPGLIQVAATTLPLARISLDTLAGGQDVQMTKTTHHKEQSAKNPYQVDDYTLRMIGALSGHIQSMNDCAADFRQPILVLHGGKDYFNNDSDVRGFVARIPRWTSKTYHNYPKAYHLLMYDEQKEIVFRDIERWLDLLRKNRLKKF